MTDPATVKIVARDVKPYHYALWSSICGGKPFANSICHVSWSEDGEKLWFGLDSFNTLSAAPDEELELIPLDPHDYLVNKYRDWKLPPRPVAPKLCGACGQAIPDGEEE
jgi:hypothetical protein